MASLSNTLAEPVTTNSLMASDLPLPNRRQGKVRDVYEVPPAPGSATPRRLLIIASDRISAFDVVMPTPIPGKGIVLTQVSTAWFGFIRSKGIIGDHLVSTDPADVPGLTTDQRRQIEGRMMLTRAARVVPIECVVRGYIAGSGWVEYGKSQTVCGIKLPAGLRKCARLPEPIFTPATKADVGHDENISFERACELVGRPLMERLRKVSIEIYAQAAVYAESRGIILADTKFEFGHALDAAGSPTNELLLIDEVLTPDSSRFWPAAEYTPGSEPPSFDKQFVRDYLQDLVDKGQWDKTPPGPVLPDHIVAATVARYVEARDRLFG